MVKPVLNTLTIQTSLKSFLLGSLGSAVILLYKRLRGSSSRPSVSSLSLPAFLSSFSLLTKLTLGLMRRIRGKDEASHGAVAGSFLLPALRSVHLLFEVLLVECRCCSTETLTSLSTCSGNLSRSVCRSSFSSLRLSRCSCPISEIPRSSLLCLCSPRLSVRQVSEELF